MTEATQDDEQRDRLHGTLRVLNAITNEANVCATNHVYYGRTGSHGARKPMLMLDFDLIAATLRPAIQLSPPPEPTSLFELPTDATQIAGPHTVRFALRRIESFALPPGAMVELLRRKTLLRQRVSDRGQRVIDAVTQALDTDSPITSLDDRGVVKTLGDTLASELREFGGMYDDLDLLEDVLHRATPLEDLVGKRPEQSDPVFRETNRVLSTRRPRKELANELDALNVAFVVWMFLSPKEKSRRQVPLLISDTQAMKDFKDIQSLLSLPQAREVQVFNRRRFLLLDSQISHVSGGRNDLIIVKANRLAHETQQLSNHVAQSMQTLSTLHQDDRLFQLELTKLDNQFARYRSAWGTLLEPLWRYPELDRVSHLNATRMPRVEQAVRSLEPNLSATQARDRLANIRSAFVEAVESDRRVQLTLTGAGTVVDLADEERVPLPFFDIGVVVGSAAKTLLSELAPGVPVGNFDEALLGSEQPLRIVVTGATYFRPGEAVFAADIARDGARITVTVVWTHNRTLRELGDDVGTFGRSLGGKKSESVELVAFGKSGESREQLPLVELPQALGAAVSRLTDVQLLELRSEGAAVFADVEPLVGVERQIGIAAPLEWWTGQTITAVNDLMAQTCHGGIPKKGARRALFDVLQVIGERTRDAAA